MKKILFLTVFSLLRISSASAQDLAGTWQGKIVFMDHDFRVVYNFTRDSAGKYAATIEPPGRDKEPKDVDELEVNGDSLLVENYETNLKFNGVYNKDSMAYLGHTFLGGSKFPMKLVKGAEVDLLYNRPQKPKKPYPYIEEEVTIINKVQHDTLAGTLTKPEGKGKFPAAILITGSGPDDRDETLHAHRPFLLIADYLTRKGFAVLRCDDRGTGKSTGQYEKVTSADIGTDVEAQLDYLKSRNDIDTKKMGLIGHTEGGFIAPLVAVNRKDVAYLVLLAAPGMNLFDLRILKDSMSGVLNGDTQARIDKDVAEHRIVYDYVRASKDSTQAADSIDTYLITSGASEQKTITYLRQTGSPWMRFFINHAPDDYLKKITIPVLAINGEKDFEVPPQENIGGIEKSLIAAGNKNFKTVILPGLNHLFQHCKKCTLKEYIKLEETMAEEALNTMGDWLTEKFLN